MNTALYEQLNTISNQEFEMITKQSPIHDYLDISFETTIQSYVERKDNNVFLVETNENEQKEVFIKYITLIDFLKFLIGKYKNDDLEQLPCREEKDENSKYEKYINDKNNYAYVDSLFYYITSDFSKKHHFPHSIGCFDQFICKKKECKINIADDLEYLCDSTYFNDNINKLYHFEDDHIGELFQNTKKEALHIDTTEEVVLDNIEVVSIEDSNNSNTKEEMVVIESSCDVSSQEVSDSDSDSDDESDDSDDDSNVVHTSDEEEEEEEEGSEDEEEEEEDSEDEEEGSEDEEEEEEDSDEEEVFLYIHKIPSQVLVLEKCENTFDYLLENDLLKIEELESAIFQIITILFTYQKVFKFTHNDLHTNNIMYVPTDETHITYIIEGKTYKVPTFGKMYKIIDFGRSIYQYQGKLLCSDSFSSNGTAHTQYNFGPYYNPKKPVIEPNYSFDLCRLACSIFDFICDDITNINTYRKTTPVYDLIFSWLYDDNNRNMLYRSNGDDKYPGFKLYKMISKVVHNHTPEKQYDHPCLQKFVVDSVDIEEGMEKVVNIDVMQVDE
tara:strand:- start:1067 stop:2734 length:1668 start_codon:yes stop_codon:yes gene_type:complete